MDGPRPAYRFFVAGVACWFGAFGAQSVLFSWLVVGVLHADASKVGAAQMAQMLPGLLLLLVGGATADRVDRRALLARLHAVASILALALLAVVASGTLRLPTLLAYAFCIGTVGAFVIPARDSLLSEVSGPDLMRAVTGLTLAQWGSQAVGSLLGSSARFVGTAPALAIPAFLFALGVPLLVRLPASPRPPPAHAFSARRTLREIADGVREVARSPVLRPVVLLVMAVGLFFIGPYTVVLPLLVRDVYGGDVGQLGLLAMAFPAGTIVGSLFLLRRGGLRRKGWALVNALGAGALALGTIAVGLPFAGTLAAIVVWGLAAAFFMNASRTLFQVHAPQTHRARVLSVFSVGLMGSGPLGALLAGFLIGAVGPLIACACCAGAMLAVAVGAGAFSGVTRLE